MKEFVHDSFKSFSIIYSFIDKLYKLKLATRKDYTDANISITIMPKGSGRIKI